MMIPVELIGAAPLGITMPSISGQLRAREFVDFQAGQDAELAAAGLARSRIDAPVALAAAKTIAAGHDVGQVERRAIDAGRASDLTSASFDFNSASRRDALLGGRRPQRAIAMLDAREHGRHAIIIALRQRIEFVIVAAGAIQRQSERGGGDRIDDVVEFVGPGAAAQVGRLGLVADLVPRPGAQKSQGRDRLADCSDPTRRRQSARGGTGRTACRD